MAVRQKNLIPSVADMIKLIEHDVGISLYHIDRFSSFAHSVGHHSLHMLVVAPAALGVVHGTVEKLEMAVEDEDVPCQDRQLALHLGNLV